MTNDIKEVLLSEEHLTKIIRNLGKRISEDYKGRDLLMVDVLKGPSIFMTDLTRVIGVPCRVGSTSVPSYSAGTGSSGAVKITRDLDLSLVGYDLLVVENILDSGMALNCILELLQPRGPKNTKICTLSDKLERRIAQIMADCVGTYVPDEFIVSYGLDYNETYRNLPYVSVLKPHVYGG